MAAEDGASRESRDPSADEHLVDREIVPVVVRAAPRHERMLRLGAGLGLLAALVMTVVSGLTESSGGTMSTGLGGSLLVFTVYAIVFVGLGLLVSGVIVIVMGRAATRQLRAARAQHDTTLVFDPHGPANDDVPRWVRQAQARDEGSSGRRRRARGAAAPRDDDAHG